MPSFGKVFVIEKMLPWNRIRIKELRRDEVKDNEWPKWQSEWYFNNPGMSGEGLHYNGVCMNGLEGTKIFRTLIIKNSK